MSNSEEIDQPLNFGSDLSIKACIGNCLQGEYCDCDHHREEQPDTSPGQTTPGPYQNPTAYQSLVSVASSGQGPSQRRPIVQQQQYQSTEPMHYGSGGQGRPGIYAGYPTSQGGSHQGYGTGGRGVYIAGQFPSGFTTPQSSYNQGAGASLTPYQQSMGWFRDGGNNLYNGRGEPINEQGQVIQPAASGVPQSYSTSGFSDESFQTAPSHHSPPSGGGSYAGSGYSSSHGGKRKHKKH